jgi:hypothetical protein
VISEALLSTLGLTFAGLAILAMAFWLAHAAWAALRDSRRAQRQPATLRALAAALQSDEGAGVPPEVERLGRDEALELFVEMVQTVAGTQRERLDEIARAWGVLRRAGGWALSRRWSQRLRAARLITLFGTGEEPVGDLLLSDRNSDVRAQAAEWAGAHPNPGRVVRLIEMLGDIELRCRFAAREALVEAGPASIVGLTAALPAIDGPPVAGALEAARSIAVPDFLPAAIERMTDSDPEVRAQAANLAASIGGPEAVRALEHLAGDPEAAVRAAAAAGLGHLGRWESAASVAGLLEDPHWRARRAAALSLRRMGPTGELLLQRRSRAADGPSAAAARSALELPPVAAAVEEEERTA